MKKQSSYQLTKEASKKFIGWIVWKRLICLVILLCIVFMPVATIKDISIGNYYELILQKIDKVESVEHLTPIIWIVIMCLLATIIYFFAFLSSVISKSNVKEMKWITKKSFSKRIIAFLVLMIAVVFTFLICKLFARPYRFKMITPVAVVTVLALSKILDYVLSNYAIKNLEITRVFEEDKTKKEKARITNNLGSSIIAGLIIFVIVGILCGCFGWIAHKGMELFYIFYDKTIYNSLHNEHFSIGKTEAHVTLTIDEEKGVEINWDDSSRSLVVKGEAYYYYQDKLEEMGKEFTSMMPKSSSSKDLEKYGKNMKQLAEDIKVISEVFESQSYSYEQLNFEFISEMVEITWFNPITFRNERKWVIEDRKRAYEYIYDAAPNTENLVKWGEEYGVMEKLLYREKIELSESEFKVGTDFSETEIVATVQYGDGSIRISVIKLNNVVELNSAKAGKQVIKWSDSWGEYEATIKLVP